MAKDLVILAGGVGSEHAVSLLSAQTLVTAALEAQFRLKLVVIDKQGRWWLVPQSDFLEEPNDVMRIGIPSSAQALVVQPIPGQFLQLDGQALAVDVVFPITHGTNGEDGAVQGLLQMAKVPVVGPDLQGSINAFDKVQTRRLLANTSVPQMKFVGFSKAQYLHESAPLLVQMAALDFPVFVKAAQQGSSVGVYRCESAAELPELIDSALAYSDHVLVEEAVLEARELEVAVMGNAAPKASPVGEILSSQSFYDFEDKYVLDQSTTVAPASLDCATSDKIRALAIEVYQALGLRGMARVDFLLDPSNTPYLIEANTLPGFTQISMYPKLWEVAGLPLPQLLSQLVALALEADAA